MNNKDKMIRFRITAEDYKALRLAVANKGVTIQRFIYDIVMWRIKRGL